MSNTGHLTHKTRRPYLQLQDPQLSELTWGEHHSLTKAPERTWGCSFFRAGLAEAAIAPATTASSKAEQGVLASASQHPISSSVQVYNLLSTLNLALKLILITSYNIIIINYN